MAGRCGHRADAYAGQQVDGVIVSNLTAQRLDNTVLGKFVV